MTRSELSSEYFYWMCSLVYDEEYTKGWSYQELLYFLNGVDFNYTVEMDGNREADGIDLRYRFGSCNGYANYVIASMLDIKQCSVLEMMIALAIRCEETIMHDPDIGDRTGQWFWSMIASLGLANMNDDNFDVIETGSIVEKFLNREYKANGKGGLFTVHNPQRDMRDAEIWYQMNWWLDEIA